MMPILAARTRGGRCSSSVQGDSTPTPKDPARRRGPTPGRTRGTGWAPSLEGSSEDASSSRGGAKFKALKTIAEASGTAAKISGCQYFDIREKGKASGGASSPAAPAVSEP
eukprot:3091623-Pyramimonas_sp.AAC.1